jgi:hypothetical protein
MAYGGDLPSEEEQRQIVKNEYKMMIEAQGMLDHEFKDTSKELVLI